MSLPNAKTSKNDYLRQALGILLKQKNYVSNERFRRSDFLLMQSKNQFVVNKMLDADLHGGNTFTYSNVQVITNNQHTVDQQFGRFSQFVEAQPEALRNEMKRFYAPMLCHLYLELLKAREPKGAVDFLKKYVHLVAPVDLYDAPLPTKINGCSAPDLACQIRFAREAQDTGDAELEYFMKLVQILSGCTKLEMAEADATVAHFRASKYEMHTTSQVVDTMCAYLQRRGHVLIMNLIYTWLHVQIVDNEQRAFSEDHLLGLEGADEEDALDGDDDGGGAEGTTAMLSNIQSRGRSSQDQKNSKKRSAEESIVKLEADIKTEVAEDEMKPGIGAPVPPSRANIEDCLLTLRATTNQVLKTQVELPRFLKISDRSRGLTTAHVDGNECHMLAGFENSALQLWQLNEHSCRGKSFYRLHQQSECSWELNNCTGQPEEDLVDVSSTKYSEEDRRDYCKAERSKFAENSYNEFGGLLLRGHTRGVTNARFSAHYPLFYSVSKDSTLRCWRAHNLQCAAIYRSHNYPIWCMDESPVGQYVVTGSKDLTARLWSLEREHALIIYAGHTQDVESIAFHPNGNYIATGSADHSVRLWCATSGKLMRIFSDCRQAVTNLAFSPDGKMLAAAGEEPKVRIFDLAAGIQLAELKDHSASVSSLAWNLHNQHLATVCTDGSLRLWDIKKLTALGDNSSSSSTSYSSSSSATTNRLLSMNSSCQRLVNAFYGRSRTLYCIGT
ncbi:uncharacterized protein Dwil_GK13225 [Drosophila willistoni]|uniref:Uncharacterized protein n=1 Tax=Drosophila willistoni TaxID=7260 RepID=B4NL87_DROWI|nr:transcription initiation factor TFIID subunit 5 [Drosophila willistoni]EDW84290.1 uncharacterized protein Dwil_GK13225 [Drosophila willistoni]